MGRRAYSFVCEVETCPRCGKPLASLTVAGHAVTVDEDGRCLESEDTDLILSNAEPRVKCGACRKPLDEGTVQAVDEGSA